MGKQTFKQLHSSLYAEKTDFGLEAAAAGSVRIRQMARAATAKHIFDRICLCRPATPHHTLPLSLSQAPAPVFPRGRAFLLGRIRPLSALALSYPANIAVGDQRSPKVVRISPQTSARLQKAKVGQVPIGAGGS
jgi:hypothetical protein